jgi:hypothetical protein
LATGIEIQRTKYFGLALVSLCILILELTLTRIFSVTMWYHFAFVAISVALFGISASGLVVFLMAKRFSEKNLENQLTLCSSLMAVSILVMLIVILRVPFQPSLSLDGIARSGLIYGAITLPFFFGGICISLLLWRHSNIVSGLYFADLLGAALGCLTTLAALNIFAGPQVVLMTAIIASAASACFSLNCDNRKVAIASRAMLVGVVILVLFAPSIFPTQLLIVKKSDDVGQRREAGIVFEKWNSFSRVTIQPLPSGAIVGWGMSETFDGYRPDQMYITIDASAGTQIVNFVGDMATVEFLKYDITSFVHWLKKRAKMLIIGPGGGRDVLSALVFGQGPVTGVELNPIIVDAVREDFGSFAGHLYDRPEVEIHIDEGRSYLSRSKDRYDIIQASLVDTWAATSSGAFVLSENNLYTVEAFESYLEHLTDDGMLTFSRWYFERNPDESLRLTALAVEALENTGHENPRQHLFAAKRSRWKRSGPDGVMTMIVKNSPFTEEELRKAHEACERLDFQVVYSPDMLHDVLFKKLFDRNNRKELYRDYEFNIVPPTDDKPFFFHTLRLRQLLTRQTDEDSISFNTGAVFVLANLFLVMAGFAVLFLILPMIIARPLKLPQFLGHWKHLAYFMLIGLGFLMVEIPLIQRFTLFLGHPIYSLAMVLFSLLLFSSLGSFFTKRASADTARPFLIKALIPLCIIMIAYIFFLGPLVHALISLATPQKIIISLALIAPIGFFMGMPFPLGIMLVSDDAEALIPWCWSLNGAFSVLASVTSIVIAISLGFSAAMAVGTAAYIAVLLLAFSSLRT